MLFRRGKDKPKPEEGEVSKEERNEEPKKRWMWPLRRSNSSKNNTTKEPTTPTSTETGIDRKFTDTRRAFRPQVKVVYDRFSDDPNYALRVATEDNVLPKLAAREVLVKVQASTVTHNDIILRRGMDPALNSLIHLPETPGYDVVGTIIACGPKVDSRWAEGDRVAALVRVGGNARYAAVSNMSLVEVPSGVDSADAVCMVSIYMTAYQAFKKAIVHLVDDETRSQYDDDLLLGKRVLVTGALGPVARAFIELCHRTGAEVFATAPRKRHGEVRRQLHAQPLPPSPKEWLRSVEGAMDVVFDGQCQDEFESPHAALNEEGILICVGTHALLNSTDTDVFCGAPVSALWATAKADWLMEKTDMYDTWRSFQENPERYKSDLSHLFGMLERGEISATIDRVVALDEVAIAHEYIDRGKADKGAVVCFPWDAEEQHAKRRPFARGTNADSPRRIVKMRARERVGMDERDELGDRRGG